MSKTCRFSNGVTRRTPTTLSASGSWSNAFSIGRSSEITRDELKFQKFINRIRVKFSNMFYEALKRQLVLKNIIKLDEWNGMKDGITIEYSRDNYYAELKDSEILRERIEMVQMMDEYIGLFWSKDWIRRNILKLNDDDIKQIAKDNEKDPLKPDDINPEMLPPAITTS